MSSSCKICVLPRLPETVAHRRFNMDRADRTGITIGAPHSARGEAYAAGMAVLTMTSCHLNGQYDAMLEVAVVCLILQTHRLIAPQSPASLSSFGTIIEMYS